MLAPLTYSGGAGVIRRASDCREGGHCVGFSLFRHSTPRVTGSLSPPALTRGLSEMGAPPPLQAARVEAEAKAKAEGGSLLLHCLHSDYKADHICALLFLLRSQPSAQLRLNSRLLFVLRLFFLLFQGSGMWGQRWNNKTSSWNVVHWELAGLLLELFSLC